MALDKATVARIATLARIRLSDDELEPLAADLSRIIGFVEQLDEVNTDGVVPMTHAGAVSLPMRDDVVTDGGDRDAILANAPGAAKGFFAVPKVVE
jgi:aspartyl-tRNA(Asn)/glutamyl-tRNA(Gln) amidotransferase subunit C